MSLSLFQCMNSIPVLHCRHTSRNDTYNYTTWTQFKPAAVDCGLRHRRTHRIRRKTAGANIHWRQETVLNDWTTIKDGPAADTHTRTASLSVCLLRSNANQLSRYETQPINRIVQKLGTSFVRLINSSNIDQLSTFSRCQNEEKICRLVTSPATVESESRSESRVIEWRSLRLKIMPVLGPDPSWARYADLTPILRHWQRRTNKRTNRRVCQGRPSYGGTKRDAL